MLNTLLDPPCDITGQEGGGKGITGRRGTLLGDLFCGSCEPWNKHAKRILLVSMPLLVGMDARFRHLPPDSEMGKERPPTSCMSSAFHFELVNSLTVVLSFNDHVLVSE